MKEKEKKTVLTQTVHLITKHVKIYIYVSTNSLFKKKNKMVPSII